MYLCSIMYFPDCSIVHECTRFTLYLLIEIILTIVFIQKYNINHCFYNTFSNIKTNNIIHFLLRHILKHFECSISQQKKSNSEPCKNKTNSIKFKILTSKMDEQKNRPHQFE